jgi:hypothetical protein
MIISPVHNRPYWVLLRHSTLEIAEAAEEEAANRPPESRRGG